MIIKNVQEDEHDYHDLAGRGVWLSWFCKVKHDCQDFLKEEEHDYHDCKGRRA